MTETISRAVVIGGGLAGAKAVEAFRGRGFDGAVTLISEEAELPYERPALSKSYLTGATPFDKAIVLPEQWYRDNDVELRLGQRADAVDLAGRTVSLSNGTALPYDRLVLATGSSPRRLTLPGAEVPGVLYLRTHADADAIRAAIGPTSALVIVGGGWIGLEVAAAARQAGTAVTVVEAAELPLVGVLGPELARSFADLHRDHGVELRTRSQLEAILTDESGAAAGVRLADGTVLKASAVVVGIGVLPRVELAQAAGLAIGNGVDVDGSLRASDPRVAAVGDIASHDHPLLRTRVRVEHWAAALNQPTVAVGALLGEDIRYDALPYFYTDQYDLGMEYVGHAPPGTYTDVVVRGDLDTRQFVAFWLRENRVLAGMAVNIWDVIDDVKDVIRGGYPVDPAGLADPNEPLKNAVRSETHPIATRRT
jgi:3-phenylpropionate/trans-cinnamate dioxygenase ferredoxin reductase subunit